MEQDDLYGDVYDEPDSDEDNDQIGELISKNMNLETGSNDFVFKNNLSSKLDFSVIDHNEFFPIYKVHDNIPIYSNKSNNGPTFFCIHGAGHSGLSFAMFGKTLCEKHTVISYDIKGHGNNTEKNDYDYSIEYLVKEALKVLEFIAIDFQNPIILLGHSLGGAIATFLVEKLFNDKNMINLAKLVKGLIVIDVSEGSAKEALPFMENLILHRPKSFKTIEEAIQYCFKSDIIKNIESARVSCPSIFKKVDNKYEWKVNLLESKLYWKDWFEGLTNVFLKIRFPKLLVMAGSERMDKELTIGHMQGKFKLMTIPNVGHFIHEDNFKNFSEVCCDFVKVFKTMDDRFTYI